MTLGIDFIKALSAPAGSNCPDQPVSTCFFSPPVQPSLFYLHNVWDQAASVTGLSDYWAPWSRLLWKQLRCEKERSPIWVPCLCTLCLECCTWAHALALGPCLSYTGGMPCLARDLASPGLALLTQLPGEMLNPCRTVPLSGRSLSCLAVSSPSFVGKPSCCSLVGLVMNTIKAKEI